MVKTIVKCIDCIEGIKQLPNESIQLVVSSPPYNKTRKSDCKLYAHYDDNKEEKEFILWQQDVFNELYRVLKPDGVVIWNFSYSVYTRDLPYKLVLKLQESGFKLYETICWNKIIGITLPQSNYVGRLFEFVWVFAKNDDYYINKKDKSIYRYFQGGYPSNLWNIKTDVKNQHTDMGTKETFHKATFPVKFPEVCMKLFSKENDWVLDPFLGTGTTLVATQKNNRNGIGFDIYQPYVDKSLKRLNQQPLGEMSNIIETDNPIDDASITKIIKEYDGCISVKSAIKILKSRK